MWKMRLPEGAGKSKKPRNRRAESVAVAPTPHYGRAASPLDQGPGAFGASPSGKAADFDSAMRRFESSRPSQIVQQFRSHLPQAAAAAKMELQYGKGLMPRKPAANMVNGRRVCAAQAKKAPRLAPGGANDRSGRNDRRRRPQVALRQSRPYAHPERGRCDERHTPISRCNV
jgi:hypothetical protein